MREIKFRVCNGSNMEHSVMAGCGLSIFVNSEYGTVVDPDDSASITPCNTIYDDNTPTMQYTGLKDKNGVEIYEGDVCETMYYTPFGDKTDSYYGNWVVTEWMGMFVLVSGKERLLFTDFADATSSEYASNLGTVLELSEIVNVRVIGNIHQNPELLN